MNFLKLCFYVVFAAFLTAVPKLVFSQVPTDTTHKIVDTTTSDIQYYTKPEWLFVTRSAGGTDDFFIRSTYVAKRNNEIKIWIKVESKTATIDNTVYKNVETKELVIFDCGNKKYNVRSIINYSNTGEVIAKEDYSASSSFEDVVPDTALETILKKVCETYNN